MSAEVLDLEAAMDHDHEMVKTEVHEKDGPLPPVICYRDPADVRADFERMQQRGIDDIVRLMEFPKFRGELLSR